MLFTIHAICRWTERFQESNVGIIDAFNDTFLFGAQHGNARYFLNAKLDAVFCVKEGYVTTVLTKAQAIANMQQNGISFDDPARVEINKPATAIMKKSKEKATKTTTEESYMRALGQFLIESDEQELASAAVGHTQKNLIEYVAKLKRQDKKRLEQIQRESDRYHKLLKAVEQLFGSEAVSKVIVAFQEM